MRNSFFLTLSVAAALLLAGCSPAAGTEEVEQAAPPSAAPSTSPSTEPSETPSPTVPAPPASNSPEEFTSGAPDRQCLTENLTVSVSDQGSSAGHTHYFVTFTNTGEECALEGFPGIQVMTGGSPLGAPASQQANEPPRSLLLTRGGTTSATLTVTNIGSGGGPLGGACTVSSGDALAVTPPHSTIALRVNMPNFLACSNGAPWMTIGPVINYGTT